VIAEGESSWQAEQIGIVEPSAARQNIGQEYLPWARADFGFVPGK
jgi:hypothetical protein